MDLYLAIVVVLFILAISDLVVGVSNDAVNFLNSAIGSKVAPRHVIMIIASIGIIAGTTFSSGLMEVARKGIFNPGEFYFPDIMIIFLAVMLTDVLLLDLFNTFALPTSTTVSIVFELLGAAVAIALLKVLHSGDSIAALTKYINTDNALMIIGGILLSVVVAFTFGAIVQYIVRMIFTFDYDRSLKKFGALLGSFMLTAITYFILVKGAKGASFISADTAAWIKNSGTELILYSFIAWAVILQILMLVFKTNVLKVVVFAGTFALALAFAANDLVNFIGVPLAGLTSYQATSGASNIETFAMSILAGKVHTETYLLMIAGIIMVVTLWTSKKAQSVTKTEVNLGRQAEGFERFESSYLARNIVRMAMTFLKVIQSVLPNQITRAIDNRFKAVTPKAGFDGKIPAFDLLRASVNLMMASILISIATSYKLPLSTTYVTFMVAMGTSLSDRAWGRESAVYRVNGVLTVIGGWFFTAFSAFTVAFTFAMIIFYGGFVAIIILILLAVAFVIRTHFIHKSRAQEEEEREQLAIVAAKNGSEAINIFMEKSNDFLSSILLTIHQSLNSLFAEDLTELKAAHKASKKIVKSSNEIVSQLFQSLQRLDQTEVKRINRFGKLISSLQAIADNCKDITYKCSNHIDNNHIRPDETQEHELKQVEELIGNFANTILANFDKKNFDTPEEIEAHLTALETRLSEYDLRQVERIKLGESTPRNSVLFIGILNDMDEIAHHLRILHKTSKKIYFSINDRSEA